MRRHGTGNTKERLRCTKFFVLTATVLALAMGADDACSPGRPIRIRATWRSPTSRRSRRGRTSTRSCRAARWMAGIAARRWAAASRGRAPCSRPGSPTGRCGWRTWAQTDVVNPWLSNGRNNFRSVEEIVASAVTPGMTDAEKAFRPVVPGDPVPPPFPRRQQRARRPGEGLQHLRLQHLRQRFHLPGHAVAHGRPEGGAGPGARALHLPGLLRRPLAFLRRRHALRLPLARQRRPSPANRTSCATTT